LSITCSSSGGTTQWHLVYCVHVMSVGWARIEVELVNGVFQNNYTFVGKHWDTSCFETNLFLRSSLFWDAGRYWLVVLLPTDLFCSVTEVYKISICIYITYLVLVYDAVSGTSNVPLNGWVINEWWFGKHVEGSGDCLIWGGSCLEGLKKIMESCCSSWYKSWDFNWEFAEYYTGMLLTWSWYLIRRCQWEGNIEGNKFGSYKLYWTALEYGLMSSWHVWKDELWRFLLSKLYIEGRF
jgi:hypothetical protein